MERDQSAVTDPPFQVELAGRANGKIVRQRGMAADRAVQDEVMGRVGRSRKLAGGASKRARARRALTGWRRRYEFDSRPRRKEATVRCPHVEQRWMQVPHPRYGDAQPYFRPYLTTVAGAHVCVPGATG